MDNRRVIKAYKERGREKVLPLPSKAGLLLKMKRYISGSSLWQEGLSRLRTASSSSSRAPSGVSSRKPSLSQPNAHSSRLISESFAAASSTNQSMEQNPDQTANEVLSTFFREKGNQPLSQIEYEGVMSLLEKSRANMSMTSIDPDQHSHTVARVGSPTRDSSFAQQNNSTLSNRVLKNTSFYDSNAPNATFAAPDYRPLYQSFSGSSRSHPPVKRVYQFSGLPSPYRTRIRAPGLPQKKMRRIVTESEASTTPVPAEKSDSEMSKPRSNTANSLLSALDNHQKADDGEVTFDKAEKPLYNPYVRNRRKAAKATASSNSTTATPKPYSTADDISKTVAFNQAKELKESPEKGESESLFSSVSTKPAKKISQNTSDVKSDTNPLFTFKPSEVKPVEKQPAFTFNLKNSSELKVLQESQESEPKPDVNGFVFDAKKPAFSFGAKFEANSSQSNKDQKPHFGFNSSKMSAFKPKASEETFASPQPSRDSGAKSSDEQKAQKSEPSAPSNFNPSAPKSLTGSSETEPVKSSLFGNTNTTAGFSQPTLLFGSQKNESTFNGTQNKAASEEKVDSRSSTLPNADSQYGFKEANKIAPHKPVFNFGAKKVEEASGEKKVESAEKFSLSSSATSSDFTLGSNTSEKGSAFSIGLKTTKGIDEIPGDSKSKPLFSFLKSDSASKPAFSIASTSETSEETGKNHSAHSGKSAFSFGSSSTGLPPTNDGRIELKSSSFRGPDELEVQESEEEKGNTESEPNESSKSTPALTFGAKSNNSALFASNTSKNDDNTPSLESNSKNLEKESGADKGFEDEGAGTCSIPSFKFGASNEVKDAPAFNFGTSAEKKDTPAFSFGSNVEKKVTPAFSFGNNSEKKHAPALNFGTSGEQNTSSFILEANDKNEKPVFSLSSKAEEQKMSGSSGDSATEQRDKPLSFGNSVDKKSIPMFNFGNTTENKDTPAFGFGNATEKKDTPAFSFGNTTEKKDTPVFSLGSTSEKKDTSAFSFGSTTEKKDTPAFSFGSTTEKKDTPAFSFGKVSNDKQPAFSFGKREKKTESSYKTDDSKPTFNFGNTGKPALSFGSQTTTAPAEDNEEFKFPELQGENITEEVKKGAEKHMGEFEF